MINAHNLRKSFAKPGATKKSQPVVAVSNVSFTAADGQVTGLLGPNGSGKTNIVEATAWLATMRSFRGAPTDALIQRGADRAIARAQLRSDGRELLLEAELPRTGRARIQMNRQKVQRTKDLLGVMSVTVFAPDDLELVKGSPGERLQAAAAEEDGKMTFDELEGGVRPN